MRRSQTSPYLNFIRVVMGGNIDQVAGCLAGNPAFAPRLPAWARHGRRVRPSSFRISLTTSMPATRLSTWPRRHFGGRSPNCWSPTEQIVGEESPRRTAASLRGRCEPVGSAAQAATIEYLISVGADPNALDRSGVSPLARAVRTRRWQAVRARVDGGADARQPNKAGSTPCTWAFRPRGEAGAVLRVRVNNRPPSSGSWWNTARRRPIGTGEANEVHEAATGDWIRILLRED